MLTTFLHSHRKRKAPPTAAARRVRLRRDRNQRLWRQGAVRLFLRALTDAARRLHLPQRLRRVAAAAHLDRNGMPVSVRVDERVRVRALL